MAEEMRGRVIGGEGKSVEVDGAYFGGYGSLPTARKIVLTVALQPTKPASVRSLSSSASVAAIRCGLYSIPKAQPLHSSALA